MLLNARSLRNKVDELLVRVRQTNSDIIYVYIALSILYLMSDTDEVVHVNNGYITVRKGQANGINAAAEFLFIVQLSFSNSIWSLTKLNRMRLDYYKAQMATEKCVKNSDCNTLLMKTTW